MNDKRFTKKFFKFLTYIGVDVKKYETQIFTNKSGESLTLKTINASNIKNFKWAYRLAENDEMILLNNNQETLESYAKFKNYKGGMLVKNAKNLGWESFTFYEYYARHLDYDVFERTKDIFVLIGECCGKTSCSRSVLVPLYIETENADEYLFGVYDKSKHKEKAVIKLANKLGLYAFTAESCFPKHLVKFQLKEENIYEYPLNCQKNHYSERRNSELIKQLKAKRKEKFDKMRADYINSYVAPQKQNDGFEDLKDGFKYGEKFSMYIFGVKRTINVFNELKKDGEEISPSVLRGINSLIKSNVLDDPETQFKILRYVNNVYEQFTDNPKFHLNVSREIKITAIAVCEDYGGKLLFAFCGESPCDEEHGVSVAFVDNKYLRTNRYMDYTYPSENNEENL